MYNNKCLFISVDLNAREGEWKKEIVRITAKFLAIVLAVSRTFTTICHFSLIDFNGFRIQFQVHHYWILRRR